MKSFLKLPLIPGWSNIKVPCIPNKEFKRRKRMATVVVDLIKTLEKQTIQNKDFDIEMWPYTSTERLEKIVEFLKTKQELFEEGICITYE